MTKEKKLPNEYAVKVSLIIFFLVIIIVGIVRLNIVTKNKEVIVDLDSLKDIKNDTNIDYTSYNLGIANAIYRRFGISVYYGDNINLESVNAENILDKSKIFSMLVSITNALSKYPNNLIKEFEAKGYTVSIYLVDHFNTNMEALANRNSIGQFKIYMSNTLNIERAMHHELYHILDYYIKLESDEFKAYESWGDFNPEGFAYSQDVSNLTGKYVYNQSKGAYFVTVYAKYSVKEDRAETFAEMVTANEGELFFNEGEPIKGKIDIIKKVLIDTFKTISPNEVIVN